MLFDQLMLVSLHSPTVIIIPTDFAVFLIYFNVSWAKNLHTVQNDVNSTRLALPWVESGLSWWKRQLGKWQLVRVWSSCCAWSLFLFLLRFSSQPHIYPSYLVERLRENSTVSPPPPNFLKVEQAELFSLWLIKLFLILYERFSVCITSEGPF